MTFQLICPNLLCRKVLLVPDDARGKTVKCQHCQMILKVPENPAAAIPAASSSQKH